MSWNLITSTTSAYVIAFIILQPIYHHKKALKVVSGLLFLYLGLSIYNFNYGYSVGDITSFAMFSAMLLSFLAQLRYSYQVKELYGFYPRLYLRGFPIKGIFIKHPDIERAHSEPDTIMTILAFLGFVLGFSAVLFMEIVSNS